MALTDRFSPFGIVLFGALLLGLLFFAFLMNSRGSTTGGNEQNEDGAQQMTAPVAP